MRGPAWTGAGGRIRPLPTSWRLPIDQLLTLAPRLSRAVADWHERSGPHGGLCPQVVDVDDAYHVYLRPPGPAQRPYLAPERIGRLRCPIDERCDLYSVGVLLYQLATGRLPEDAGRVTPPRGLVPDLPPTFEEIVLQLLARPPYERYRTAEGLANDLERCHQQLQATGQVEPFLLACRDLPETLRLSGRLFGREKTLGRLMAIRERVRKTGGPELAVVAAEPGLGKTALLDAFADAVTLVGGRVAGGGFAAGAGVPYAGIAGLVDDLGRQLAGADHRGEALRLHEAIGPCAAALADLSPAMAGMFRHCPPAPEAATPAAARHRLHLAVRRLVAAVTRPGEPLVVTLDDLHEADDASARLLYELVGDPETRHLVVVAGCAAGLPAGHPASELIEQLQSRVPVASLPLRPLPDSAMRELVADTLTASQADSARLVREMAAKTGSVPLLAVQFLHRLHERGALTYDPAGPRWRWPLRLPDPPMGLDDLGAVVRGRLSALAADAGRVSQAAAVLGDGFDLETAAEVAGVPRERAAAGLREMARAGLLTAVAGRGAAVAYRWTNRRLAQAVVGGLTRAARERLRAACARALRTDPDGLFAVVGHGNAAPAPTDQDRIDLVRLNLAAGRRAWRTGAVAAAHRHLRPAADLMRPGDWATHQELALEAHTSAARAWYALDNPAEADRLLAAAWEHAAGVLDRARIVRARMAGAADPEEALRLAATGLVLLGAPVPADPPPTAVDTAVRRARQALGDLRPKSIAHAPAATDPRVRLALDMATDALFPLAAGSDRAALLAAVGVELSLRHGCTPASSRAFACLAVALARRYGDETGADRCLRTALRLMDDRPDPVTAVWVLPAVPLVLAPWLDGLDEALDHLHEAYLTALEQGEIGCAQVQMVLHCAHRFLAGAPLDSVVQQVDAARGLFARGRPDGFVEVAREAVEEAVGRLAGEATSSTEPDETAPGYLAILCATVRLAAAYVLGELAEARRLAAAIPTAAARAAGFAGAEGCFYRALVLATARPAAGKDAELDALQGVLDGWAARSPALYAHKALLVSAERARIAGDVLAAQSRFDQAIAAARRSGTVHIEAIAAERAGAYAAERGEAGRAAAYLHRARACYEQWNARAKLAQLADAPQGGGEVDHLDLLALGNAMEALSGDLGLDRVVASVAELFLQNTGADRACLLLVTDGDAGPEVGLRVAAVATNRAGEVACGTPDAGVPLNTLVPMTVVDQVRTTRQVLAAGHQSLPNPLRDPYLDRRRPRALLCAPLLRGDRLVGLVYLETDRQASPGAVRPSDTLRLLCLQAAGAIDHAVVRERLFEASQVLDAAIGRLPVGLILLGPDLTVRRASPHAARLTGLPMSPGTPVAELFDVLSPTDSSASPYALELALASVTTGDDEPLHRDITVLGPHGPRVRLHTTAVPLRRPDRALLGMALLVTEARDR